MTDEKIIKEFDKKKKKGNQSEKQLLDELVNRLRSKTHSDLDIDRAVLILIHMSTVIDEEYKDKMYFINKVKKLEKMLDKIDGINTLIEHQISYVRMKTKTVLTIENDK